MSSRSTASPDQPYEFFIDECVAARPVASMLRDAGHRAHVQHDTFGSGTPDLEWLPEVGARQWILITKDKQIRKREIELRALRQANIRAFVLTAAGLTGQEQAHVLERALPAASFAATAQQDVCSPRNRGISCRDHRACAQAETPARSGAPRRPTEIMTAGDGAPATSARSNRRCRPSSR